jgi:phage gp36-like protein
MVVYTDQNYPQTTLKDAANEVCSYIMLIYCLLLKVLWHFSTLMWLSARDAVLLWTLSQVKRKPVRKYTLAV